jgi:glucosamine-6-phosphate deaminase
MSSARVKKFQIDRLKFEVYESRDELGRAAAEATAEAIADARRGEEDLGVIFATGASQLPMLHELVKRTDVPWRQIVGFHMDEYEGLPADHFASFRRYMRQELVEKVPLKAFHEIDDAAPDVERTCAAYAAALRAADPQVCLLGIGENGHLAFNDPFLCDFDDPADVKLVTLDQACREQQVAEGWFARLEHVPERALTLTIPALMRVPRLIVSVPGARKAHIVRRVIEEPVSTAVPATLLKTHPNATVYLDNQSSAEIADILSQHATSQS